MESKRFMTVSGKITLPYSWGLYTPVILSAIAHMSAALFVIFEFKSIFI
ncbi:unknown [Coraliomargarita sp. CAG:312]|nr:unknown [Coraliomargarita sp. CAG:312]